MTTRIDRSFSQLGEEDFSGSIRRAAAADGKGLPWIAATPGGREKRFRSPSSAWRWLRSLRQRKSRGQLNTQKRLDWVYRNFPAPVFVETVFWYVSSGEGGPGLTGLTDEFNASTDFEKPYGRGSLVSTPEQAEELKLTLGVALRAGDTSPLDRYIPWFASSMNQYYKQYRRAAKKPMSIEAGGFIRRLSSRFHFMLERRRRAFVDWLRTRPNLQGVAPFEAYATAVDWEESQFEEGEYRKAKALLAKGGVGRAVMRLNGWTVREIGTCGMAPPWGDWVTAKKRDQSGGPAVDLKELSVVGRILGHCYKRGAHQQTYGGKLAKGQLALLTVFDPSGMPRATVSVVIDRAARPRPMPPRLSIGEVRGLRNETVSEWDTPLARVLVALTRKLWSTGKKTFPRIMSEHFQDAGELFGLLIAAQDKWSHCSRSEAAARIKTSSISPFEKYLFAGGSLGGRPERMIFPRRSPTTWTVTRRANALKESLDEWEDENVGMDTLRSDTPSAPALELVLELGHQSTRGAVRGYQGGMFNWFVSQTKRGGTVHTQIALRPYPPNVEPSPFEDAYEDSGSAQLIARAAEAVGSSRVESYLLRHEKSALHAAYLQTYGVVKSARLTVPGTGDPKRALSDPPQHILFHKFVRPGSATPVFSWQGGLSGRDFTRFTYELESWVQGIEEEHPSLQYREWAFELYWQKISDKLEEWASRKPRQQTRRRRQG